MEHRFFEEIHIQAPMHKIYARLGYANGRTNLSSDQQRKVDDYIFQAKGLLHLQGSACRLRVMSWGGEKIILEDNISFSSAGLANNLRGAQEVLFMGATAGNKIYDFIKTNSSDGDNTAAVIFDAVASEAVDSALGWIGDFYKNFIRRENKTVFPNRFSCGYGDFSLNNQKVIYDKLQLKHFGVELTPTFILKPEKSVTALLGIKTT